MATLVLNNDAISVSLESDHLVICQHNLADAKETLPIRDLERVVVIGKPAITFPVLARLMDRQIPCVFLTKGDRFRGVLDTSGHANVARRLRQYDQFRQAEFSLRLCKGCIGAKLRNCRRVIQRLCANRGRSVAERGEHWVELNSCLAAVETANDIDAVRGIEGIGTFHYFRLLAEFFPGDFPFASRSRQPPLDEANAVLSFVYMVLMNEVLASVRLHALDAGLGFLHADCRQAPSLALDLMEPFRPGYADLLALDLLGHGRLEAKRDFERDDETGGVYLARSARGRVLAACERAFSRRFLAPGSARHTTVRLAIDAQSVSLVQTLERGAEMEFFRLP